MEPHGLNAFSSLKDPRVERHKRHKLLDILILTICAVMSGAEGWEAIEQFGKDKEDWLRQWLDLANGISSHDCIARVISRIEPSKLSESLSITIQKFKNAISIVKTITRQTGNTICMETYDAKKLIVIKY